MMRQPSHPGFRFLFVAVSLLLLWHGGFPPASRAQEEQGAAPAPPAPRIEVDSKEIDLGRVVRGEDVQGSFTVRNAGNAVLNIVKVKPG
jgi:hypothetical protein